MQVAAGTLADLMGCCIADRTTLAETDVLDGRASLLSCRVCIVIKRGYCDLVVYSARRRSIVE
jgi:hypothetical protein